MANIQKCVAGTEAVNDALLVIVNKALAAAFIGAHVGGGRHVAMPTVWDKYGDTPAGWTKQRIPNYVLNVSTTQLPISDALATELQLPASQARLTVGEQTTLATALAARANFDLQSAAYVPKVGPVVMLETDVIVFFGTGQSVMRSDAEGAGTFPTAAQCQYWNSEALSSAAFAAMTTTAGSKDVAMAKAFTRAGRYCVIMNFAYSATTSLEWLGPSGIAWTTFVSSCTNALAALSGVLAGRTPRKARGHDQGEKNVSDAAGLVPAQNWAADEAQRKTDFEALCGAMEHHIYGQTRDPQPSNFWITQVRAGQATAATAAGGANHLLNRDDVATRVDGIHPSHPTGERDLGERWASRILQLLYPSDFP